MRAPLIQLLAEAEVASSQASYILAGLAGALVLLMAAVKCGTLLTNPSARKYFFGSLALLVVIAPLGYLGVRYSGAFIEGFKTALAGDEQPPAAVASAEKKENTEASEPSEFAKSDNDADEPAADDVPKVTHVAHEVTQRSTNPNTTQQFPELNFEFTPPDVGWIKLHAPSVSQEAAVAYTSKAPQMIFFVIAERLGADVQVTNEALFDIIKSNIYANYDEVEVSEPVPQTLAGIEGLGFTVNYAERAVDQRRAMWIGSQGGFLFQLVTTGRAKNADRLDERHRQMLAGFRVIDQSALVYSQGREPIAKFASKDFGYEVDLSGAPWLQAAGELQILSAAEMAATLKGKAAVAFVPVQIPHDGATIDDVATVLASGLVDELDAESRENVDAKPADADGVEELSFGYQLKAPSGAAVAYRFRVLRQGRRAVMGVGLAPAQEAEALQEIEKGIATLRFTGPAEARNDSGAAEQQAGRGMVLNTMGLEAFDHGRQELSLACFEEAIRLLPNNPTPTLNYAHVLAESGRLEDAISTLEKRIGEFEESHRLQEKLASLLFEAGDQDRCAETLKRLLSDGYRSEEALVILVGVYMKQEKYPDALAAVDDYLKAGAASPQVTQMKAVLLSKVGDHDGAIALLEEVRKQRPRDPSSVLNLAVAYCEAERFDEALALTQQLLDQGKATDEVHLVRGRCYLDMKQYAEAKAAFEQAHAANPRSREAEEAIAVASALLGQGNNSIVKTPIDPVPLPEEIAGRLTQIAPDDRVARTFGAYEHFRVVGYDYRQGERWRTTTYRKIKIVGQEGVDRFATLNVTFSPLSERLFVNRLAVYDAAGKLLAEGNPNDYYVVADAKSDLATGDSTLTIPVPQLLPGNTLEYTLTREQLSTVKEFGYEEVILTGSIPVQAAAAFVVGDVSKLAHTSSGPEPRTSASGGLFWGVTEPPVFVDESSQPPIAEFLPVIHLADAGQQWETIGNEYAQKIADRLQPDPVSEAKARELTANLATPAEKIAVLSRFVQKQLNYQGLEFGVRGLIPNTAAKSLEIGYGDCKDHSVLLKQLLNAAGLPAQLTLVNATGEVDGRLPSPSQFDHMIVSLPGPDGGDQGRVFIDCTSKHANPLDVTCDDFSGASALVIEPSGSRLVSIPPRSTVSTDIRCSREITVVCDEPNRETADAIVREQVSFSATPANVLRAALTSMQPRDRKETVSRLISEHDSIDMTRLEFLNLEDPTLPLVIELEYRMDNIFHRVGERGSPFTGRIVSPWEAWATLAYTLTDRATPFRTTNASVAGTTRYVLPAGFTMDRGLETIEAPTTNRFLLWRIEADRANQTATVRVDRRSGSHAAAEYQPCALEAKELAERLRRPISIVEIPATARAEEGSTLR